MPRSTALIWEVSNSKRRTRQSIFSTVSRKRSGFICLNSFFSRLKGRRLPSRCVRVESPYAHVAERNNTPQARALYLPPKPLPSISQLPQTSPGADNGPPMSPLEEFRLSLCIVMSSTKSRCRSRGMPWCRGHRDRRPDEAVLGVHSKSDVWQPVLFFAQTAPVEIEDRSACRCRPPGTPNTGDRMWHVGYQACPAWPDMRLLHQLGDSVFLGRRRSHASFCPSPFTFLSDRFSEKSANICFSAVVSRRRSFTAPEVATRAVPPPGDVYPSRGSPWTRHVH